MSLQCPQVFYTLRIEKVAMEAIDERNDSNGFDIAWDTLYQVSHNLIVITICKLPQLFHITARQQVVFTPTF